MPLPTRTLTRKAVFGHAASCVPTSSPGSKDLYSSQLGSATTAPMVDHLAR